MASVPATEAMVKSMPSLPDLMALCRFMPKPKPTTLYCSRYFDISLLKRG